MKYFVKLNIVSFLYAFIIFVPIQLMVNVYRISRLAGLSINTISIISSLIIVFQFIFATILFFFLAKKWMDRQKTNYLTAILWIPYFVVFNYLVISLFPITNVGDNPSPVVGILAIILLMFFPVYILIINFLGFKNEGR